MKSINVTICQLVTQNPSIWESRANVEREAARLGRHIQVLPYLIVKKDYRQTQNF
ncbi:hypothetical protein [Lysinibacillus sphaericus]|uniref:hypothetical protein n=1 Tax=Lysinibacillus sphaericus TaxID=1421 RepID=UPI0019D5B246|nr:hypothetical protein [Lysinibacillus sphaericus]